MSTFGKGIRHVVASAWRRTQPKVVRLPTGNSVKIFEQKPPAWARWALALVAVDIMVSTSAVDIVWNTWGTPAPPSDDDPRPTNPENGDEVVPPKMVLRPAWQRASTGVLFFISGFAVAGFVLAARSRLVNSLTYVRGPRPQIFLQTPNHHPNYGLQFALKDCSLIPGNSEQMVLDTRTQGRWVLNVRGAILNGRPGPMEKERARSKLISTWKSIQGSTTPFTRRKTVS
ncbi:unnamed protein product [Cyclocybe aegerita]|uniref:Uncharacterized protein n=1 Tax=Cyclocybe aegerita TaxID=1973307 RepID=A0A8S0W902_CYCAE|nr:unnamed protein product [Cyclocybe aegerita]